MRTEIPKIQQLLASPHIENCQLALSLLDGMGLSIKDVLNSTPIRPEPNTDPLCHNHSYTINLGILSIHYQYISKRYEDCGFYAYVCKVRREVRTLLRKSKTKQKLQKFNRVLLQEYGSPYAISEQQFKNTIKSDYHSYMIDKMSIFIERELQYN